MTLKEANRRLNKLGYNIRSEKMTNYDTSKTSYDTWVEYKRKNGSWGIESTVGRYDTQEESVAKAASWLKTYTGGRIDITKGERTVALQSKTLGNSNS